MEYKWIVISNTTLGTLMASLDGNIVLVALPTISRELHSTSLLDLIWVIIGYQLVTTAFLVNFGRLGDMYGRVKMYNLGFALFTASSALCSLAQSGTELIAFRLLQGVGAAFLFSNSAAIITDAFPERERGKALGINQVSIVVGSVSGLVLGGILTALFGWQSIFLVNVPIGVFATVWSHYKLKELAAIREGQKIDMAGNITIAAGLASVLTSITLYAVQFIGLYWFSVLTGGGVAVLVLFVLLERRAEQPMLNLSLFKIRLFSAGNIAIMLNALARGCVALVLTFYLQGPTMGFDPLTAGIFLVPISLSLACFGPVSGFLSDKYGSRGFATLGLLVSCAGFLLLTDIGDTIAFAQLALPLVLVGSGMGLFASPNRASIMNSVPKEERGIASGTSTTLVNMGNMLSLGIAFLVLTRSIPTAEIPTIFLGGTGVSDQPWIPSFIGSIHSVYYISTAFLLIAIVPSVLRGREVRGRDARESEAPEPESLDSELGATSGAAAVGYPARLWRRLLLRCY